MNDLVANTETYVTHIKNACKEAKALFGEAPPDVFIMIGSCGKELIAELKKRDPDSKRLNVWYPKKNENINKKEDGKEFTTASLRNYLPKPFKEGHYGTLHLFLIGEKRIMVQEGRAHLYENQDMQSITFTVRMLAEWGTKFFITTSRSHSTSELYESANDESEPEDSIGLIVDHINQTNYSPFSGVILGKRNNGVGLLSANEINMSEVYDIEFLQGLVEKLKIKNLAKRVYIFVPDISFTTPAEIDKLNRTDGVIGISLVPETTAAYQAGMKVIAFTEYAKHRSKKEVINPLLSNLLLKTTLLILNIEDPGINDGKKTDEVAKEQKTENLAKV